MSKPSIKDIAKIVGVTDITVSRTFTSPEKVKKETREKILRIAQELNYTPNLSARSIRSSKSKIIGLIADDIFNPVYAFLIKELNAIAEKEGYSVMIFNTNGCSFSEEVAIQTLISYSAAGAIVSPISDALTKQEHFERLIKSNIQIIQFDRQFSEKLPGVFIDSNYAGELVGSLATGNTLIVGGPSNSMITRQRINGILQKLPEDAIPTVVYSDYHFEKCSEILKQFNQSNQIRFDCIIGVTGLISLAVISELSVTHDDAKLMSIDEIPLSNLYGLHCTYVNHNYKEWARLVAENLFNSINKKGNTFRFFIRGTLNEK
ncbi:LacI family transcriptional regulator [Enterobacter bugandensis]|uniref:LacI family DNA-binding transcriptional regulator n=1 Tax=Enterobacter bugandensis TaxID=881260 RepID=UPI002075DAB3|nr:LacI family DNA-binding transcriptional regulator [Enterobacter bugandensis]MCM7239173.1 LacI family transcriptional regulator [Enterobacter bugandensis]MCM7319128.1 LacI family transcriptional regulator [Enterobacter bugandensis]MCM7354545.1 LacI family transcriptional regulator [Enterobacter bugandensis]